MLLGFREGLLWLQTIASKAAIWQDRGYDPDAFHLLGQLFQLGGVFIDQILLDGALLSVVFNASSQIDAIDFTLYTGQAVFCGL